MIEYKGNTEFSNIAWGGKMLTSIYYAVNGELRLIWEQVRSCYGSGIWIPERPWLDGDIWKNSK